jgi:hypothetical protein
MLRKGKKLNMNAKSYREQYDRMIRFLKLLEEVYNGIEHGADQGHDSEYYRDRVHSFFQNCYHLKDWVKNDSDILIPIQTSIKDYYYYPKILNNIKYDPLFRVEHCNLDNLQQEFNKHGIKCSKGITITSSNLDKSTVWLIKSVGNRTKYLAMEDNGQLNFYMDFSDYIEENFINKYECMRICADLCNGSKHSTITRARGNQDTKLKSAVWNVALGGGEPILSVKFNIECKDQIYDALELARKCVGNWDEFITKHNLPK